MVWELWLEKELSVLCCDKKCSCCLGKIQKKKRCEKTGIIFSSFCSLAEPQVKFLVLPGRYERKSRREMGRSATDQSHISEPLGQRSLQILLGEGEILFCHVHVEREENHGMKLQKRIS